MSSPMRTARERWRELNGASGSKQPFPMLRSLLVLLVAAALMLTVGLF